MSWHGKDYDTTLKDRTDDVKEFLSFVTTLRHNNQNIPILVGGDFNMDMKSYDFIDHKDLSIVQTRPVSGKNVMRDLRNTFLYTMDTLQVQDVITRSACHIFYICFRSRRLITNNFIQTFSTLPGYQ